MIELKDIVKQYGASAPVLNSLKLTVKDDAAIAVIGPSGCGKSTLLNIMGLLDTPTQGLVTIDGKDSSEMGAREQARIRNRTIGFVFQQHHLLPQCTVIENVLLPVLAFKQRTDRADTARARALLDAAGLDQLHRRFPAQLSGGECQRVAVVRALINRPRLILADEPTGSLDPDTAVQLVDLLRRLHAAESLAIVMVTHAPRLAAMMDTVLELRHGRLEPLA